jgi:hypothetical protein
MFRSEIKSHQIGVLEVVKTSHADGYPVLGLNLSAIDNSKLSGVHYVRGDDLRICRFQLIRRLNHFRPSRFSIKS